jgi:ABC-type branched-subunit amino acid transport system substrate-binding protein
MEPAPPAQVRAPGTLNSDLQAAGSYGGPLPTAAPPGRGVALLAPLTGPNAERGAALANAAKLALQSPGSPPLDVRDTGGTPDGAASAAQQAIAGGAGLIIGPLTSGETAGAARVARPAGVPILAFTTDPAQAQPGVWTLGITPGQQVRRLAGAVAAQGKTRIAALLPQTDFGQAMAAALGQAASAAGAGAPDIHTYPAGNPQAAVRELAAYGSRVSPLMGEIRAARAEHDAQGRERAAQLSRQDVPPPPFDALLLADAGGSLTTVVGLLQGYEVGPPAVRILGPALWAAPAARGGADLTGAWYAAPDPAARANFTQSYQAQFATPAPGLADFAYDAASIARVVAQSGGYTVAALCRPDGFTGVDGVFVLQPDGTVRRGLALFEVQRGGPSMIEPAPASLSSPGI